MGQTTALRCTRCDLTFPPDEIRNLCSCGSPLFAVYDLQSIKQQWNKEGLQGAAGSMWRYEPALPTSLREAVTLGEGWTPLHPVRQLGREMGGKSVWLKDEGRNPTDSFAARGLSAAVTMARKLGLRKLAIACAGNGAGALAAYAALAQLEAHIFMPRDVSEANFLECISFGANVSLVNGLTSDCARVVAERKHAEGWFDVSALNEPYRVEGAKTIGYEIAEQFGWQLPDAILHPCGVGLGLIGMWKAFAELEELGWISSKRPKMIAVQAAGCAPLKRAFERNEQASEFWRNAHTVASGLRVPKSMGDFLILRAVRESGGTVISVTDEAMIDAGLLLARAEGIFAAPETGACLTALQTLFQTRFLSTEEEIVIISTGSGLKYQEAYSTRYPRQNAGEQDKLGGLITPR